MPLTEQQKQEAIDFYIHHQIRPEDREIKADRMILEEQMAGIKKDLEALKELCSHPLIARETNNDGYSGDWDNDGRYWTVHDCRLCGHRWHTNQSWARVGGKHGHPDDPEAKVK